MTRRRAAAAAAAGLALAAGAAAPSPAAAHGLSGRADLPVPTWLFSWAAAVVLVASFVVAATVWRSPRLEHAPERPLVRVPCTAEVLAGVLGVALFAAVVASGLAGTAVPADNLAPAAVYVAFWVGVPLLSALVGDVFRALSPWRAVARAAAWAAGRARGRPARAPLSYPARLGRWPAAAGVVAFAWVELVYVDRTVPAQLAVLALAYATVQLAGMGLFGIEPWSRRADAFGVAFGLFARLAPLAARDGRLVARRPLAGLAGLAPEPGTVALVCTLIGATTFDGAVNGALWGEVGGALDDGFTALGASSVAAGHLAGSLGLAGAIALVAGLYAAGVAGMRGAVPGAPRRLAARFAHTLVPIALAYALAHYFSLVVFQGQDLVRLASDPLGNGADLLGTADRRTDLGAVSATSIWYVQVAGLIAGHVAGLLLAHDRALVTFARADQAVRSQYWMLAVMVGYTGLGLWLLSAVST